MKTFKIGVWLISIFLFPNCASKLIIKKTTSCSNTKNEEFNDLEKWEVEEILNKQFNSTTFKLKNKGSYLEFSTKSKKIKNLDLLEKTLSKTDLIFRKIGLEKNQSHFKVRENLGQLENFKFIEGNEKLIYKSSIVGYVENENDLTDINIKLALENISLIKENMFWLSNSVYLEKNVANRRYLIGTKKEAELRLSNILNFTHNLKAYIDAENFEPAIKLFLNECGINEFKKISSRKTNTSNIYAVIIDNKINSIQRIRIRNNNEVCLFGFKTLNEAKSIVQSLEKENLSLKFK